MMSRRSSALAAPTRLLAAAALALAFWGCGEDAAKTTIEPLALASEAAFEAIEGVPSEAPGGLHERIDLIGQWTIEVADPDGAVVLRQEIEGSLRVAKGNVALSQLQDDTVTSGLWGVDLFDSQADHPCVAATDQLTPAICTMRERTSLLEATNRSLVATVPASGPDAHKLVIKGNLVAQRSGTINTVQTSVASTYWRCAADFKYSGECDAGPLDDLTVTPLDPKLSVRPGQRVDIKVVVSLSS